VNRALWGLSRPIEHGTHDSLLNCRDLFGLMRLLLEDVNATDNSPAPNATVTQLLDLALARAELFSGLLFQVQAKPGLLADLVLHPPSAALACLLIAQWRRIGGAWDRDLIDQDYKLGQAEAFADAVSILGEHLRAGSTKADEAAALLNWLHYRSGPGFVDEISGADSLIAMLRRELASCPGDTLLAMVQSLDGPELRKGLDSSEFAAALDIASLGGIEDLVDAQAIVTAYRNTFASDPYSPSTHRIGAASATALAEIARRTPELRAKFLYPIDVRSRLEAASSEQEAHSLMFSLPGSLRPHIRTLCRAIVGETPEIPADLFDALVSAVRIGALAHKEMGRVAAFAPRFEKSIGLQGRDRPLAEDLAEVLLCIDAPRQATLLAGILETNEPHILAQLLPKAPSHLVSDIKERIVALAPANAGAIMSLPEMQARIDELLTAGAADAAENYMAAEANLETLGKAPARELVRFQNRLRLNFLRDHWSAIAATPDPDFANPIEQATALETLKQFRAIAAIKGPNADPEIAKVLFAQLFDKRPSIGFATNWFAAEISCLLHTDTFALLKGAELRRGRKALSDFETMAARLPNRETDAVMECNRAVLLLAMGEPEQALAVLSNAPSARPLDVAASYRAIAFARLGRLREATATLDAAEFAFSNTRVIAAARAHIATGAPYLSVPEVSLNEDLLKNVSSAISRLRSMSPIDQAKALQPESGALEDLLIDHVRAAAGSVVALVPMMKDVRIDSCEDDLTAFIQHLLAGRVHFLNWTVGDQSRGGFTLRGNPGERDLRIEWGSTTLAVVEAVVYDQPLTHDVMKADLESHFQKLLGYGNQQIFFHLTYAYEETRGLMPFLEKCAEIASPAGFTYKGREPIPHSDSRPPGFVARYAANFGEVKVVFLVLDLGQKRQRAAAITAAKTKTRKAPKKKRKAPGKTTGKSIKKKTRKAAKGK
jgi:tetratricopeptide (TPR) repeat protein